MVKKERRKKVASWRRERKRVVFTARQRQRRSDWGNHSASKHAISKGNKHLRASWLLGWLCGCVAASLLACSYLLQQPVRWAEPITTYFFFLFSLSLPVSFLFFLLFSVIFFSLAVFRSQQLVFPSTIFLIHFPCSMQSGCKDIFSLFSSPFLQFFFLEKKLSNNLRAKQSRSLNRRHETKTIKVSFRPLLLPFLLSIRSAFTMCYRYFYCCCHCASTTVLQCLR